MPFCWFCHEADQFVAPAAINSSFPQYWTFEMLIQTRMCMKEDHPDLHNMTTVKFLNIRTPKKFVVSTLKFELCGSTIEY